MIYIYIQYVRVCISPVGLINPLRPGGLYNIQTGGFINPRHGLNRGVLSIQWWGYGTEATWLWKTWPSISRKPLGPWASFASLVLSSPSYRLCLVLTLTSKVFSVPPNPRPQAPIPFVYGFCVCRWKFRGMFVTVVEVMCINQFLITEIHDSGPSLCPISSKVLFQHFHLLVIRK